MFRRKTFLYLIINKDFYLHLIFPLQYPLFP